MSECESCYDMQRQVDRAYDEARGWEGEARTMSEQVGELQREAARMHDAIVARDRIILRYEHALHRIAKHSEAGGKVRAIARHALSALNELQTTPSSDGESNERTSTMTETNKPPEDENEVTSAPTETGSETPTTEAPPAGTGADDAPADGEEAEGDE